ncbi:PIPO, partial [Sweet potato mild mottle virus]|uniref:PIPO n=1 Tax=Sweet potato mild mottle virus TaxID=41459 RepID=UPI000265130A
KHWINRKRNFIAKAHHNVSSRLVLLARMATFEINATLLECAETFRRGKRARIRETIMEFTRDLGCVQGSVICSHTRSLCKSQRNNCALCRRRSIWLLW